MTLVLNRLLQLSGNKRLILAGFILLLAACSPKLSPVVKPVNTVVDTPVIAKKADEPKKVATMVAPLTTISLLLPFRLDELDLSKGAPKTGLSKAELAMEYYQGFKLALDSLTNNGRNFKLQLFDTKDAVSQAHNLAINTKVRTSALIVGPVYPDEIKSFSQAAPNLKRMLVSPLSPSVPSGYNNSNLVTMIPPLEYHCWKAAAYIQSIIKAKKVFVLKSGYSEDNKYAIPFKKAIDSLGKKKIKVIELTVVRGDLSAIMPQLSLTESNVFVVPATDQQFLTVTMRALDLLSKKNYRITVLGHPNWENASFLKPDLLQRLNTFITSSDRVNYKAPNVIKFLKDYRKTYHTEPGEFAIKGYDEGLYFGMLANPVGQAPANLADYTALHNTFHFVKIPGQGYVNTSVKLYKYVNFELKPVE